MKTLTAISLLLILTASIPNRFHQKGIEKEIVWDFRKDVETLLPSGSHTVDVIDIYDFTLGCMEKTGKTYIVMKGEEIVGGQTTISYEIPVIFQ